MGADLKNREKMILETVVDMRFREYRKDPDQRGAA